jgi:phospholipase/carboxylesterase
VGFSGGAAFAGGLLLDDPQRWAGVAVLYGTLPFDAGLPVEPGSLPDAHVLVIQGDADAVIPRELLDRTWDYLTSESGADVTAHRGPEGHGLSAASAAVLSEWIRARS